MCDWVNKLLFNAFALNISKRNLFMSEFIEKKLC